jgi:hypothetical protein
MGDPDSAVCAAPAPTTIAASSSVFASFIICLHPCFANLSTVPLLYKLLLKNKSFY